MTTHWSATPVIDWLLRKGRMLGKPEALVRELCERVRALGMPLDRVGFLFWTLHPQYGGVAMFWDGHLVQVVRRGHDLRSTKEYLESPIARIAAGERVIRRRLERPDCPMDFPMLEELKDDGITDYLMVEVVFSNGGRNAVSLATRRPGGFGIHDIAEVERLLHPFALVMEIFIVRETARTLLDTYLGRVSGARVLEGQIARGSGEEIDAVIWFADLRGSTALSERLGERKFLELLNEYFECTAGAVLAHRGEVLRFIGDASLAVFPLASGEAAARCDACERAIAAAREARTRTKSANARRAAAGLTGFEGGIGLHLGRVLYGNIGTAERLEFSVIGAAANEAARVEALSRTTGHDVVVSRGVREALGADWPSLGSFDLRGVSRAIEVYALPADEDKPA